MEGNKVFELGDEALEEVAGGFEAPGGCDYAGKVDWHCNICHQVRRMKLYKNNVSETAIMICPECGERYYNYCM